MFGVSAVGGLPEPLGGGGPGGIGDEAGVAVDELLLELDDGEFAEEVLDGALTPCAAEELPEVEPELGEDV
jgi:hypothetical protein